MNNSPERRRRRIAAVVHIGLLTAMSLPAAAQAQLDKIDPSLRNAAGRAAALIEVEAPAPAVRPERRDGERLVDYRRRLIAHLQAQAEQGQAGVRAALDEAGLAYRAFWIANAIRVEADADTLAALSQRRDVRRIYADKPMRLPEPIAEPQAPRAPMAVEWNIDKIRAPQVWAAGVNGQGVVIAGQDTGYRWDHNALRSAYRGWNGAGATHDYHWHDAIHEIIGSGTNPCGLDAQAPCDDNNHGTHTMGTMVGDDGGVNQIGVAPGARWIGCRNMERGNGTPSTYAECFEWFVAPTDLAGANPDPAMAPDVINNSWGCPPSEGCTTLSVLQTVVENVRAAGIVVVVSAGNDGSGCSTITTPAAIYDASFTIGSTTSSDAMSGFSSRGPVPAGGGSAIKPDVVAPGSGIRSSTRTSTTSYGNSSGTSMAGPHVAGAVALLISANPALRGDVARIEQILRETAVPVTHSQTCGGIGPSIVPNYVSGHGRIDVWEAFRVADTLFAHDFEAD